MDNERHHDIHRSPRVDGEMPTSAIEDHRLLTVLSIIQLYPSPSLVERTRIIEVQ